jgi:hypothetical protein
VTPGDRRDRRSAAPGPLRRLGRRPFLRGFAGALLSLPLLEACKKKGPSGPSGPKVPKLAEHHGALESTAKRFIALMAPDGVVPEYWFPTGTETDFTLGKHNALLEPHQARCLFMKGVHNAAAKNFEYINGHIEGVTSMLTGLAPLPIDPDANVFTGNGPSIDQVIAGAIETTGYVPKVRSLHFGEEGAGGYSAISYAAANQPMDMIAPLQAFELLFDDAGATEAALLAARARQKSILDGTLSDFERVTKRVSGEDKKRIDAHLEAVRDIEKRLESAAICQQPTLDLDPADDDERRTLYYDILVAAMTCDATRVATASFHHSGGGGPQLPFAGIYEDIHELSHQIVGEALGGPAHLSFDAYHQWYTGKIAYLVSRMQDVLLPDGKTLFDETVIFRGSEISWNHDHPDMPFLVVAGASTPFASGRYVELAPSVPHNHLLVTLGHAFGVEMDAFGDPTIAAGNLDDALLVG